MSPYPEIGRTPKQTAQILFEIYHQSFGGKPKGRFRTSRNNFRRLANLPVIEDSYLHELSLWLRNHGLIFINLDNAFCIFPESSAQSFRRLPETIIATYTSSDVPIGGEGDVKAYKKGQDQAWRRMADLDPGEVCGRIAATYQEESNQYQFQFFGHDIFVSIDDREIYGYTPEAELLLQRLKSYSTLPVLYYLLEGRDTPPSDNYLKPKDLLPGSLHANERHVLPLNDVARKYGRDVEAFLEKGRQFGGEKFTYGDASLRLRPFPNIPAVIILWEADDEFPARVDVLMDANCKSQLPQDVIWMVAKICLLITLLDVDG